MVWLEITYFVLSSTESWLDSYLLPVALNPLNLMAGRRRED